MIRRLARAPMFTAVTVLTIAVAIGANAAVFSVINGVLLKPLPYENSDRLVSVWLTAPGFDIEKLELSAADYFTFREEGRTFQDFGVWTIELASITGLAEPEQVQSLLVTSGTLESLGVQPILGRWFTGAEDSPTGPDTAILTYALWQRKFGGAPSVIGRTIQVSGKSREIIGVMPQDFRFLDRKPELIMPLKFDRSKTTLAVFNYPGIARMKPGVTLEAVNRDVARMIPLEFDRFQPPPGFSLKMLQDGRIGPNARLLKQEIVGGISTTLWLLMGTISIVLLIASANVANLLLVRADGRQQELAIRTALGARRSAIARELLFESFFLAIVGGLFGIGVAWAGVRLLIGIAPTSLPLLDNISIDWVVVLFTSAISAGSGLLFGLFPVMKYAGPHLVAGLRGTTRSLTQSRDRHQARNTLVVVQMALALVLLIGSGLMIRTLQTLRRVQPGFTQPNEIQALRISIPSSQVKEPERVVRMQNDLLDRIASIPGVVSVAMTNSVPTDGNGGANPIFFEGRTYKDGEMPPIRKFKFIGPDYFRTLGNRVIAGRDFSWTDLYEKRSVAIVSEKIAREQWHEPSAAIGKRLRDPVAIQGRQSPWREIVGVVEDVHDDGSDHEAPALVYWPSMMSDFWEYSTFVSRSTTIVMRTSRAGTESLINEIRTAIWAVNSNLPLASVRTLSDIYGASMARTSFALVMFSIAGAMALLLGLIGIYGVMSYSVSQRTREIGIRIALGAEHHKLKSQFVRDGLLLAIIGAGFGLVASAALTRFLSSLLFQVNPIDPITYITVTAALVAAAVTASYLPARRATAVNPVEALRAE
jgi:predicted permease